MDNTNINDTQIYTTNLDFSDVAICCLANISKADYCHLLNERLSSAHENLVIVSENPLQEDTEILTRACQTIKKGKVGTVYLASQRVLVLSKAQALSIGGFVDCQTEKEPLEAFWDKVVQQRVFDGIRVD